MLLPFCMMIAAVAFGTEPVPQTRIHKAVDDYFSGNQEPKEVVINTYGKLSEWDVSQVTDMGVPFPK